MALDAFKLLFGFTLILLVGFSISFSQMVGWPNALPWVATAWIAWIGGVAFVKSRRW